MKEKSFAFHNIELKRDTYGFVVRPQHLKKYEEYANIYKEEEEERSDRWINFLERQALSSQLHINGLSKEGNSTPSHAEVSEWETANFLKRSVKEDGLRSGAGARSASYSTANVPEKEAAPQENKNAKTHKIQIWGEIRPSLGVIEQMMSVRVMKNKKIVNNEQDERSTDHLASTEEDSEDEFYDVERSDPIQDASLSDTASVSSDGISSEPLLPWKEELECLVRGGVPMALRGELWQAFVGARVRRVGRYYQDLLAKGTNIGDDKEKDSSFLTSNRSFTDHGRAPELWTGQIEKDLPRTFPGHPALDEDGRNALRRLLTAYARYNPSVGYCQAMNFFAGLLLLLMPEENAFWTLMGIMDDYFDGYYSEEMIESQVDQLVFEELMRERFPTLVNHLDYLGVQVAWFTGPWFLSIFVNMLPWESVLRVWDVILFEGNRVMLFRTGLALMELYGPALVTTKDAGDAVTLMQSLACSTFDSSQLVLTACMGYQAVNETRLQELRDKCRPSVIASIDERSKGLLHVSRILKANTKGISDMQRNGNVPVLEYDDFPNSLTGSAGARSAPDPCDQVELLKVEIQKVLGEKRSAILRAEELQTALIEMVKQDNRHQLSAKVEKLKQEVAKLRLDLAYKQEQEENMLQVLMRVEQEQRETEDARILAEQDVAAQKEYAHVLQGKYEETMTLIDKMKKRVVMAESMLEATLQYQSGQIKGLKSPRSPHLESSSAQVNQEMERDLPARNVSLLST